MRSGYTRKLITIKEAANILGIAESTLRGRKAGTAQLTRIKHGSKSVRMILQEVQAHLDKVIQDGQRQTALAVINGASAFASFSR